jgi:hypothetical protein
MLKSVIVVPVDDEPVGISLRCCFWTLVLNGVIVGICAGVYEFCKWFGKMRGL